MSFSLISFIAFTVAMLSIVGSIFLVGRKSRGIDANAEDVASKALPEIGALAERKHEERFGRAATDAPGADGSWYPEVKKKSVKASG